MTIAKQSSLQTKTLEKEARAEDGSLTEAAQCKSCGRQNPRNAQFCADCGIALQLHICTTCSRPALPGGDICEGCGTWLLAGQCMFCSAPIADDQKFCGRCGNPAAGIECPGCGTLSIFDFCKTCSKPFSDQAKALAQEAAKDPVQQRLLAALGDLARARREVSRQSSSAIATPSASLPPVRARDEEVTRMKAIRDAATGHDERTPRNPDRTALFSSAQRQHIARLNDEVAQEVERRRLQEEQRRQEDERRRLQEQERIRRLEAQVKAELSSLRGRTFSSPQEARRFFMAILANLPEEIARSIIGPVLGWRCNAYGATHQCPSECAAPIRGGEWIVL